MPSQRLLDHFRYPQNVGELVPPALCVEVVNPACGDILRLSGRVEGSSVADVAYKARGCPASIAAGSALTELIIGKTRSQLQLLRREDVEAALDGLDPASKHAAELCIDAVKAFLTKWE
jgi:nitrogen fixation NifU-like protein